MSTIDERLDELKGLLKECDHFINNYGEEIKRDVADAKSEYQEACAKVEKVKKDCEQEYLEIEAKGKREGYSAQQFQNLKQVCYYDPIEHAEENRDKALEYLHKMQKYLDDYPLQLQGALHDRPQILKEIQELEKQKYGRVVTNNSTDSTLGQKVIGIIFWIIVICTIFKACSGS